MRKDDFVMFESALFVVEQIRRDCVLIHRERDHEDLRVIDKSKFKLNSAVKDCWEEK